MVETVFLNPAQSTPHPPTPIPPPRARSDPPCPRSRSALPHPADIRAPPGVTTALRISLEHLPYCRPAALSPLAPMLPSVRAPCPLRLLSMQALALPGSPARTGQVRTTPSPLRGPPFYPFVAAGCSMAAIPKTRGRSQPPSEPTSLTLFSGHSGVIVKFWKEHPNLNFEVHESSPFPIALSWKGSSPEVQNGAAENQQCSVVFPKGSPISSIKALTFYRSSTFSIDAIYTDVNDLQVQPKTSTYTSEATVLEEAKEIDKEEVNMKWHDINSDITEVQKQATSKLPFKMTKRCKALMRRILCFSQDENLVHLLVAWVKTMKPIRADWLSVLKEMERIENPLFTQDDMMPSYDTSYVQR